MPAMLSTNTMAGPVDLKRDRKSTERNLETSPLMIDTLLYSLYQKYIQKTDFPSYVLPFYSKVEILCKINQLKILL